MRFHPVTLLSWKKRFEMQQERADMRRDVRCLQRRLMREQDPWLMAFEKRFNTREGASR
jgi:hypothetical protein